MKIVGKIAFIFLLTLNFSIPVFVQLKIGGEFLTDNRVRLQQDYRFTWNENRLTLKGESNLSQKAHFFTKLWIRNFGFPTAESTEQLGYRNRRWVEPWSWELREGYLDLYGFLTQNLDVRIGKQRIAWGTADKINPTDNLNPKDLEDPLNFGKKLPTNALKLSYYLGDYTLTGVFIPVFTPAVLPPPDWSFSSGAILPLPPGATVEKMTNWVQLPDRKLKNTSSVGLKLSGSLFNYDVSVSYVVNRWDMPLCNRVTITPTSQTTVVVSNHLIFPRQQIIGADMAGQLFGIGIWAEAAAFLPEKVTSTLTQIMQQGTQISHQILIDHEVYVKYVAGGDYTFRNGIYVNGQFIHGFYGEEGKNNLNDYVVLALEKKFLNDDLKLRLATAIEVHDWNNLSENYATVLFPEISYYPANAVELLLGAYSIEGKKSTIFGNFRHNDELYVKAKVSF